MRRKLLARRVNVSPMTTVLDTTPTVTTVLETTPTVTVKTVLDMAPKSSALTEETKEVETKEVGTKTVELEEVKKQEVDWVKQLMLGWSEKEAIPIRSDDALYLNQAMTHKELFVILNRAKQDVHSRLVSDVELNMELTEEFVTRAETALFVFSLLKLQDGAVNGYTDYLDIPEEMRGAVGGLSQLGYLSGMPDGSFCPHQQMTRAEVISLINQVVYNVISDISVIHMALTAEKVSEVQCEDEEVAMQTTTTTTIEVEVVETETETGAETEAKTIEAEAVAEIVEVEIVEAEIAGTETIAENVKTEIAGTETIAENVEAENVETETREVETPPQVKNVRVAPIPLAEAVKMEQKPVPEPMRIEPTPVIAEVANEIDVVIQTANTVMKNQTIAGDFFISSAVCEGKVYLDCVTIKGNLIIEGGGKDSIYMRDVKIGGKLIVNKAGVSVMMSRETEIPKIEVMQQCHLYARRFTGDIGTVVFQTQLVASQTTLALDAEKVEVGAAVDVLIAQCVETLHVKQSGEGTTITTDKKAKIANLIAEAKINVLGVGEIGTLVVNTDGVTMGSSINEDEIAEIEKDMEFEEDLEVLPLALNDELPELSESADAEPLAKILTYIEEIGKNKTSESAEVKKIVQEIVEKIEQFSNNDIEIEDVQMTIDELPQMSKIEEPTQEREVLNRSEIDEIEMEAIKELEEIKMEAIEELKEIKKEAIEELKELKKLKATMVKLQESQEVKTVEAVAVVEEEVETVEAVAVVEEVVEAVETVEAVAVVEEVVEAVETVETVAVVEEVVEEVKAVEAVAVVEEVVEEIETVETVAVVEEVVEEIETVEAVAVVEEVVEAVETVEAVAVVEEVVEEVETVEAVAVVEEVVEEIETVETVAVVEEVVEEIETVEAVAVVEEVVEEVETVEAVAVVEEVAEAVNQIISSCGIGFNKTIDETGNELQMLSDDEEGVVLTLLKEEITSPVNWTLEGDGAEAFALITDESNPKTAILGVMSNVAKSGSTATIVATWSEGSETAETLVQVAKLTVTTVLPPINTALRLQEAIQNHDGDSPIVLLKSTKGPITAEYKGAGQLVIDTNRRTIRGNMKIVAKKVEQFILDGNVRGDVVIHVASAKNVTINGVVNGTITIHETANADVEVSLDATTTLVSVGKSRIAKIIAPMAEVVVSGTIDTVEICKAKGVYATGMVNLLKIHDTGKEDMPFSVAGHGVAIAKIFSAVPLVIKDDLRDVRMIVDDFENTMEIAVKDGVEVENIEANTNLRIVGADGVNVGKVKSISLVQPKELEEEQSLTVRTKADADDRDTPPAIYTIQGERAFAYDKDDISLYVNKKLQRPTYTVQYAEADRMILLEENGAGEMLVPMETTVELLFDGLVEGTSLYYMKSHESPITSETDDDIDFDMPMDMDIDEVKMKDLILNEAAEEIPFADCNTPIVFTMGTVVTAMIAQSGLQKNKPNPVVETIGTASDIVRLKINMECVDKTKLASLIDFTQTVDQREYTAKTWTMFVEAMRTACKLLETEDELTQQEIDRAFEELKFAYEVLMEKPTAQPPNVTFMGAKMLKEATWKYVSEIGEAVSFIAEPVMGVSYSYEILVGQHVKKSGSIKNNAPIHITFGSEKNDIAYNINIKASDGTLRDSIVTYQVEVLHSLEGLEIVGMEMETPDTTTTENKKTTDVAMIVPNVVEEAPIVSVTPVTPMNRMVKESLSWASDSMVVGGTDDRMKQQAAYLQSIVAAEGL